MYIVIEGQDGTGKSTQANLLADYFRKQGKNAIIMEEPDGDLPQAHELHDLILTRGKDYHLEPFTNVLLFTASRLELWTKIAKPALESGSVVISARNWWSTLAYQGYGEGIPIQDIIDINQKIMPAEYINPTKSIILTLPDEIRLARQQDRGKAIETFEAKDTIFQQKVNDAYLSIAKQFNINTSDATGSIDKVFNNIKNILQI